MIIWYLAAFALAFFFWEELKYPFSNYFNSKTSEKNNLLAAERLARVTALSDNSKDIETFIKQNVSLLSEESMSILVARLETIKSDQIISGESLKSKIDSLEEVETEQSKKKVRAGR